MIRLVIAYMGYCLTEECQTFKAGKDCPNTCWNPNCKNRNILNSTFPKHSVVVKQDSSAFAIVSDEEIIPGEGISPLFGTIVLYDQLRKNLVKKNPNLCYCLHL